jgi:hypothetical protein
MKKLIPVIILCFSLCLFSCAEEVEGSGNVVTQTYSPFSNFTKVSVDHAIDVTILYGTVKKVHITGYENLLDDVKISASGGVLKLGMDPDKTYTNMNLTAVVVMPTITELTVNHTGSITVDSFPEMMTTLNLHINGAGNIKALHHPWTGALNAYLNNSGSIDLNGTVSGDQHVEITSAGNFNAFDMGVNNSTLNITGTGNAQVSVKLVLNATISGSGNVEYKRYPTIISNITGTGSVINAN